MFLVRQPRCSLPQNEAERYRVDRRLHSVGVYLVHAAFNRAVIASALNLIDLFCTLWALRHGAVELNPLMREVTVMVGYKVIIVWALLWWLSRQRERAARYALYVAAVVYGAVDVYHIINILQ